ncbi:hypothetical protein A262_23473, partial [Pseudomonas syringae pv. actinidiae ICMP 19073]
DFASSFFKGIAIAVILIFVFVAVLTGSLLFLIGPVAMAFIAALKLLNWENPIHHEQSLPWGEYNFVTDQQIPEFPPHRAAPDGGIY